MYLVKDHHEAIIDRVAFNRVQTEIARRTSLRKPSKLDEKGKYSGKYALTGAGASPPSFGCSFVI